MIYKNISSCTKTFYGVSFKPGEVKDVPGFVNDKYMIVESSLPTPQEVKEIKPSKQTSAKSKAPKVADDEAEESKSIKEEENG